MEVERVRKENLDKGKVKIDVASHQTISCGDGVASTIYLREANYKGGG